MAVPLVTRFTSLQNYDSIFAKMREYTHQRTSDSPDLIWLLEHPSVFTQGQAGKKEHIIASGTIPVIQSDRGGQVTYHGPGQLLIYTLVDLKRRSLSIKSFVSRLETAIIQLLFLYNIDAHTQEKAPGIYVSGEKIASVGLRVRQFRTYHGLSLNVNMDLSPFHGIHPCGFSHLQMTQISHFIPHITLDTVIDDLLPILMTLFGDNE